jgi:hypothetical protein
MSEGVAILVPVLERPANVKPLLESIAATTPDPYRVLFLADPGDRAEQDALALAGAWFLSPGGSYAAKIRAGVEATDEPLLFLGADDLRFRRGWLEAARAALVEGVQVIGVNDAMRRRHRPTHATHFLMTREYALQPCADGQPGPLSDAYSHSFVDDECIATARHRGVYTYAQAAVVEHRHWTNRGAKDDATYRRGRARFEQDRAIFHRRAALWT